MNDAILRRLEAKLDRRSFLRGSTFAAAALLGAAAASPLVAFAQTPDKPQDAKKKDEPGGPESDVGDVKDKAPVDHDEKKSEPSESTPSEDAGTTDTKVDADGLESRACPQCGSDMYRQGRTWTCENCGYSYIE